MLLPDRRIRQRLYAAVVLGTTLIACPNAQASPPDAPPGIRELIGAALATHPSVLSKRAEREAAESNVEYARQQLWPTPSISNEVTSGGHTVTMRLSQPIWSGGKFTADIEYARLQEERATASIEEMQRSVALRVVNLHQAYLFQRAKAEVIRTGLLKLQELNAMIDRRIEAGVSAQADRQLALFRVTQSQSDLASARTAAQNAAIQLAQTTGLPATRFPTEGTQPAVIRPPSPLPLPRLGEQVLLVSPALKAARLDEAMTQIQIQQTRALLYPKVNLRVERQIGSYPGSQASGNRVFLTMDYTPGAGLSTATQIQTLTLRQEALANATRTQEMELIDRVGNEWHDLTSALTRIEQLEASAALAQNTLESIERLFRRGGRTWTELLNAVRELTQTQLQREETAINAWGADHRLGIYTAMNAQSLSQESTAP